MITGCVRASAVCACKWDAASRTVATDGGAELAARGKHTFRHREGWNALTGPMVTSGSLRSAELGCAYL